MNKILNQSIFKSTIGAVRNYAFKSDLKIKWVRPERILCIHPKKSGDLEAQDPISASEYMLEFQNSKELETADENVKRLFQLGYNPRRQTTYFYASTMKDRVRRHQLDNGSMESILAEMTANIRRLQETMDKNPQNKRELVHLKELIDKRKRFLRYLRRWDYKRFEWILEKLNLVYKAYPTYYHWVTRRESLTKLTNIHCDDIRNERLAAYRSQLETQQLDFLTKKLENLEFIRKEQIECAVAVTVTPEQIKQVRQQLNELKSKKTN